MIGTTMEETRFFFNERAESWDKNIGAETVAAGRRLINSLGIGAGSIVLDVGCGTGVVIPWLLEAVGTEGRITALDIAEKMLLVARSKFEIPNIEYIHGTIEETPFLDSSFDVIVCHNCFLCVAGKERALREMSRILKPGGRVAITFTESRDSINRSHRSTGNTEDVLPDEHVMRTIFSNAGFKNVSIYEGNEEYVLRAYEMS